MKQKIIKYISLIYFCLGIFLIFLNLFQFVIPLRSRELYKQPLRFPNDIELTPKEIFDKIDQAKNLPHKEYTEEINQIVHNGIVHYWENDKIDAYHMRIPIYENWILYSLGVINPNKYGKWELCDYRKALERGVGLCSQQVLIMRGLLKEHGIDSRIIGLDGHVVITAQVDKEKNEWWIFDPDYGVVVKNTIEEIENNPEIIRSYYSEIGTGNTTVDYLVSIYSKDGNSIAPCSFPKNSNCLLENTYAYCGTEKKSYILIWLIPVLLVIPYLILKIKNLFYKK